MSQREIAIWNILEGSGDLPTNSRKTYRVPIQLQFEIIRNSNIIENSQQNQTLKFVFDTTYLQPQGTKISKSYTKLTYKICWSRGFPLNYPRLVQDFNKVVCLPKSKYILESAISSCPPGIFHLHPGNSSALNTKGVAVSWNTSNCISEITIVLRACEVHLGATPTKLHINFNVRRPLRIASRFVTKLRRIC